MRLFKFKPSKKEYTYAMLPHTRKEVFFDVLKLQWKSLLLLGFVLLAFSLPMQIARVIKQLYTAILFDKIDPTNEQQYVAALNQAKMLSSGIAFGNVPLLIVFSVGFAGISRAIRQYAYEECVHFTFDFSVGVKQNVKQMALLAAASSLMYAVSAFMYGLRTEAEGAFVFVSIMPIASFWVVFAPIFAIMTVLIPVYDNSFRKNFKIATYVYVKNAPKILLACVCSALIFLPSLIPNFLLGTIGNMLAVVLVPISMLGFYLYLFDVLDEYVNKENYPEIVGKGTF